MAMSTGGLGEPGDVNRISPDVMLAVGGRMRRIADFDPAYLHAA